MGLELIGVTTERNKETEKDDKYFLRRSSINNKVKAAEDFSKEDKRMYFIFAIISVENNNLAEENLDQLNETELFDGCMIHEYMKELKNSGYVKSRIVEDILYWSYGWRFYAEYEHAMDTSLLYNRE